MSVSVPMSPDDDPSVGHEELVAEGGFDGGGLMRPEGSPPLDVADAERLVEAILKVSAVWSDGPRRFPNMGTNSSRQDRNLMRAAVLRALAAGEVIGCYICGEPLAGSANVNIDHDHASGVIRGVLCRGCNIGLGGFRDSPRTLIRAAAYIASEPTMQQSAALVRKLLDA